MLDPCNVALLLDSCIYVFPYAWNLETGGGGLTYAFLVIIAEGPLYCTNAYFCRE
jgi:hypothetical protein